MKLAKIALIASAVGFFGFGIVLFIAPELMETAGLKIMNPAGAMELRAFYGGIELGLAMFFVIALKRDWILPGLTVLITANGMIVFCRLAALVIDNFQAKPATYWSLAAEGRPVDIGNHCREEGDKKRVSLGSGVWSLESGVWGLGSGVWGQESGVRSLGSGDPFNCQLSIVNCKIGGHSSVG